MKKYWLALYPDTFLWVKNENGCIYNAVNYRKIRFENKGEIAKLTEVLLDINRLYRVDISEELLQKQEVNEWINEIINTESGKLVPDDGSNKQPVSLKPELKLQDGADYYTWEHNQGIDGDVIHNLHQLVFHINGSNGGNIDYAKQTIFPIQTSATLGHEKIVDFIRNARSSACLSEIIMIGDVVCYPDFEGLLLSILNIGFKRVSVYCLENDFLKYIQTGFDCDCNNDKVFYTVLVSDYTTLDELMKATGCLSLSFVFLVRSEEEYECAEACVENYKLQSVELIAIYTGNNLSFFEESLYMDTADLAGIELSKREVFIRQTLNVFSFGNLTVLPNGKVYANLNDPSIGNIDESPQNITYREMTEGKSWLRIRKQKPCCDCIYQWLCPSPSNYEFLIGKSNLCFQK